MPDAGSPTLYFRIGEAVERAMDEDGVALTPHSAWSFLYRYMLGVDGDVPHIVESNDLRTQAWRARAVRVLEWLRSNLAPGIEFSIEQSLQRLNTGSRIATGTGYTGNPANLAGASFEYALAYLIDKFCGVQPLVRQSIRSFRGYEITRRAEVEQLDLALFSQDDFRLVISVFWTTRKDRIAADLYEATFLRRRRPDINIAFVVNEYRENLLAHLLNAPDVDRVYHVCRDALLAAHFPFDPEQTLSVEQLSARTPTVSSYHKYLGLRESLFTLPDLFDDINRLKPG